jgi:hypothetical protein
VTWATDGSNAVDRALVDAKVLAADGGGPLTVVYCEEFTLPGIAPCPVLVVPAEHNTHR